MTHDQLDRLRQERDDAITIFKQRVRQVSTAQTAAAREEAVEWMQEAHAYVLACSDALVTALQTHLSSLKQMMNTQPKD